MQETNNFTPGTSNLVRSLRREMERLAYKRDRYRKALEYIAAGHADEAVEIARAVLKGE